MVLRNGQHGGATSGESAPAIGVVVRGSLSEGLQMRLAEGGSVEDLRVGKFVVIRGETFQFFAMVSDVELGASHPGVLDTPPQSRLAADVVKGTATFGAVKLRPMLMVPNDAGADQESLLPVKTIPAHFSPVADA